MSKVFLFCLVFVCVYVYVHVYIHTKRERTRHHHHPLPQQQANPFLSHKQKLTLSFLPPACNPSEANAGTASFRAVNDSVRRRLPLRPLTLPPRSIRMEEERAWATSPPGEVTAAVVVGSDWGSAMVGARVG